MKPIFFLLATLILSSCSVVMAAKTGGIEIERVQSAWTRAELIALGVETLSSKKNENGELVEMYKIEQGRGSSVRAFMHVMLDAITFCLWELASTPIETALTQQSHYVVSVTFDKDEQIQSMELHQYSDLNQYSNSKIDFNSVSY